MADFQTMEITPSIRVIDTDKEWIVQTAETKRTRNGNHRVTGEWIERAYITSRSMLNGELKRLVGHGAVKTGLVGHVGQDVLDWLDGLPARHRSREAAPAPTVLDILEAQGIGLHDAYDLRDDLPLIVQHGPLKYRDRWNARYDV